MAVVLLTVALFGSQSTRNEQAAIIHVVVQGSPMVSRNAPLVKGNIPYVALVDLGKALGGETAFESPDGSGRLLVGGASLTLQVGSKVGLLDSKTVNLGHPPFVYRGTLYVPCCQVAAALGYTAGWDTVGQLAFVLPKTPIREKPFSGPSISLPNKNYGPFDQHGIPMKDYRGTLGVQYNPLVVSEYAQAYFGQYIATGDESYRAMFFRMADWLDQSLKPSAQGNGVSYWYYTFNWPPYNNAPWVSAITQGQGVDVLLDAYILSGEFSYIRHAESAFAAFYTPVAEGGVQSRDRLGHIFLEEAPTTPPSRILNGFMSNLLTAYRYGTVMGDPEALQLFHQGVSSLGVLLPLYDVPSRKASLYDLYVPLLFHLVTDQGPAKDSHPIAAIVVHPPTDSAFTIDVGQPEAASAPGSRLLVTPTTAWSTPRIEDGRSVRDFGPVAATYKHAAFYIAVSGDLLGGDAYEVDIQYRDVSRERFYLEIYSPQMRRYVRLGTFANDANGQWKWLAVQFSPRAIGETYYGHIASVNYHHMHVGYLQRLYELTGNRIFADYRDRWSTYEGRP